MSDELEGLLRDEARRDATRFDAALHARVMRRVAEAADRPEAARGRWPVPLAAAAGLALAAWLAWPTGRPAARVPDVAGAADRSIGRLLAPMDAIAASPADDLTSGAAGVSRFLGGQLELATSFRPSRRDPT